MKTLYKHIFFILNMLFLCWGCSTSNNEKQSVSGSRGMQTLPRTPSEGTERRIALVVGNKDYQKMNSLKNPLNDVEDMSNALESLGFEVISATNTDYRSLLVSINSFKDKLSSSDVALFYYSGHGVSYGGKNYLLPIDADISCLEQIEEYGVPLNRILGDIAAKNVRNSFVFLDACRNLPNLKLCSSSHRDLAVNPGLVKPTNNPRGSMVVYATEEGSTADDNFSSRNGLFTEALLKYLTLPDLGIREIIDKTTIDVEKRSNGNQSPGRYDKLQGNFVFLKTPVTNSIPIEPNPVTVEVIKPETVAETPKLSPATTQTVGSANALYPSRPNQFVNDYAEKLSASEEQALERKLRDYAESKGSQIAVVLVKTTSDVPIREYTVTLANRWGIGQKGKNNGIVFLVNTVNRKIFIATGTGLQKTLPDDKVEKIIREDIVPSFKTGNFYVAIDSGINGLINGLENR